MCEFPEALRSDNDAVDEEEDAGEKPDLTLIRALLWLSLPEDYVEDDEEDGDDSGPDDRPLIPVVVVLFGNRRCAVDQAFKFSFRLWFASCS